MNFAEKTVQFKNSANWQTTKAAVKLQTLALAGGALENEPVFRNTIARNVLPEPFDFPSHIGNVAEGSFLTMGAFIVAAPFALMNDRRETFKRNAKAVAMGAFALSTLVQVVGEKYGLHLPSATNTNVTDWLDAAYGTAFSAMTAMGAYSTVQSLEESLHTFAVEVNDRLSEELGYRVGAAH